MKAKLDFWQLIRIMITFLFNHVLRLKLSEEKLEVVVQFIKFGLVGVSNTLISYVVYLIGIGCGIHYLAASVLGFVISVVNSFYWNNKYVFAGNTSTKRSWIKTFLKTFMAYAGTGLILNNILLVIWVDLFHLPQAVAPLVNLFITIPLNFILNKLWAFKEE